MQIYAFTPTGFGANTYVISSGNFAAVVDPSVSYEVVASKLKECLPTFKYIILTHAHFDHMLQIDDWVENTDAEVLVGAGDGVALSDSYLNCYRMFFGVERGYFGKYREVFDGELITVGDESIRILSTPGHTVGSITLVCSDFAIVGDTVFAGYSVGRTDLPGGDYNSLIKSIKKIAELDEELVVYSGHGGKTNISEIKKY